MEKKMWIQPLAVVQKFVANEYVAACWSVRCILPTKEKPSAFDPFHANDTTNLHRLAYCGADDAFAVRLDENGKPVEMVSIAKRTGSTNGTKSLGTTVYTDDTFTTTMDISNIKREDTIYFTTVNEKTWSHHGQVTGDSNHS